MFLMSTGMLLILHITGLWTVMTSAVSISKHICGIIVLILTVGGAILLPSAGRDMDPGIATRRRFCATQTRRSPEILGVFQGNERHVLRVARTRLGAPSRNLVVISSPPKATGEYKMRE